jgi:hypothetical protein
VDDDLMIHMIIEDRKPIYPKTTDSLKRMAEIQKYLKDVFKRPEL